MTSTKYCYHQHHNSLINAVCHSVPHYTVTKNLYLTYCTGSGHFDFYLNYYISIIHSDVVMTHNIFKLFHRFANKLEKAVMQNYSSINIYKEKNYKP